MDITKQMMMFGQKLPKTGLIFWAKPPGLIDSSGTSFVLIDKSGKAYNATVKGYLGSFNGSTYARLSSPITLNSGYFKFRWLLKITNVSDERTLIYGSTTSTYIRYVTNRQLQVVVGGSVIATFNAITQVGTSLDITLEYNGSSLIFTVAGVGTQTISASIPSLTFNYMFNRNASVISDPFLGEISLVSVYNSTGIIHNWVLESQKDGSQDTVYDTVGGNNATLIGATFGAGGFWGVIGNCGYLAKYGGEISGDDVIPFGATNTATFTNLLDAPANICVLNFPAESPLISADTTNLIFTAGVANNLDPASIPENTGDNIFKGPRGMEIYSTAQSTADIARILKING